jgi:hypothetical protein
LPLRRASVRRNWASDARCRAPLAFSRVAVARPLGFALSAQDQLPVRCSEHGKWTGRKRAAVLATMISPPGAPVGFSDDVI